MALPDNYRPATSDDVPEGRACGNCEFYDEEVVNEDGLRVFCTLWRDWVRGDHYCDSWLDDDQGDDEEMPLPVRVAVAAPNRGGSPMTNERGAGRQVRHYNIAEFEFRDDGASGFTFEGVASVVDAPYEVTDQWGTYVETIRSGAFNKTLRDSKADVALFVNHDMRGIPLATRGAGTLRLTADPNLRVVAELDPARPDVQTIRSAVSRGEMSQMSIGFYVPKARDKWNDDMTERTISEVQLVETSIVWRGANPATSGVMRSVDEFIDSLTDLEMTEDELRRAILALEARLPAAVQPEIVAAVVTDELRTLWDQRATPVAWL
jgi:HK97 family phage prohead protease